MRQKPIIVIGGGLAGSEAAWQLAERGLDVNLFEMRPTRKTEAHQTSRLGELVCSNSFGSNQAHGASGILKSELTALNSLLLRLAQEAAVPAGASLAVDRDRFAALVTEHIESHPRIHIQREAINEIPKDSYVIIATGPLTTKELSESLCKLIGQESLFFYDAISPIVSTDSLDLDQMFFANRYDKGETEDFLNIPLTREQYETFVNDLLTGDCVLPHNFEKEKYFESCMPIEAIAARGPKTLSFGPLKPVGLTDPKTGRWPFAAIQLRTENQHKTAYNLVGCQTKLKYGEQLRIFRKLPGLENAEFLRLGSMHRNTYINSPQLLSSQLELREHPGIFIAGQLTGTEGYLESVATGLVAGINLANCISESSPLEPPAETILGSLLGYISDPERKKFQPTNVNMGLLPPLEVPVRKDKKLRNQKYAERSTAKMSQWLSS